MQGSTRYFEGRLIFAEVDPSYRNPYFDIDTAFSQLIPHEDGRPKATKFIKSYRTMEHVDYSAIGKLYICNSLGEFVALESSEYDPKMDGDDLSIILEINPIKMMVLTKFNFVEYSKYITDPHQPKGAPCMFYTQLDFNADEFLAEFDENPFIRCFVPGIHPARLRAAIQEVQRLPERTSRACPWTAPMTRSPTNSCATDSCSRPNPATSTTRSNPWRRSSETGTSSGKTCSARGVVQKVP